MSKYEDKTQPKKNPKIILKVRNWKIIKKDKKFIK